jgi:hypothetical protein
VALAESSSDPCVTIAPDNRIVWPARSRAALEYKVLSLEGLNGLPVDHKFPSRDERDAFGISESIPVQEVEIMPTYILLSSLTPEGSQTLHKTPTGSTQ